MRARLALAAVLASALLAGCAPHSTRPPCPAGQRCLLIGNSAEPGSLDPSLLATNWEGRIAYDLMVGLVQNDEQGNPVPGIAASWETSPDGRTWTFHLRDAQWSDGAPVTADDFVFGLRRVLDPKSAAETASLLYVIKGAEAANAGKAPLASVGVQAIDAHTLRIELVHPAPFFLQLAKHPAMSPIPRQAVAKWGEAWAQPGRYVSDGPYMLTEWKQNDHVTLVKNPRFFDVGKVCLDRLTFYPTMDYRSAERRIRRDELDTQDGVLASRVALLRQPDQIPGYVRATTEMTTEYYVFNTRTLPALRDRRVRQALTMDIDRDFVSNGLYHGLSPKADTFVPPGMAGYPSGPKPYWADWSFAKRQAEAKRLMQAAGYGAAHPLSLKILIRSTGGNPMMTALVQSDWSAIGVKVQAVNEDAAVAYAQARAGDFDIFESAWGADYNDPMTFLFLLRSDTGAWNYAGYQNPRYDALLDKANAEQDETKRAAYLTQAEGMMLEDAPVAPLWFWTTQDLVNPRITGWRDNPMDFHPERYMCVPPDKAPAGH